MAVKDDTNDFTKDCTEFVHSVISTIPSPLERLTFLASLLEPATGEYKDQVLEALLALRLRNASTDPVPRHKQGIGLPCGKSQLDYALRHEHLTVFEDWLCLSLQQEMAELESFASSQGISSSTLFRTWAREKSYERLLPPGAMPFQRRLFLADMETMLETLGKRQPS